MQLDLTKLSETQKKFYVQLLAQSNIEFQKKDNQYIAQFKIDSNKAQPLPNEAKQKPKAQIRKAQQPNPLIGTKKPLGRTVKIGELKTLQTLHPNVEIYIHPKRLPFAHLAELIQGIYQKMWIENKKKTNKIKTIRLSEWVYNHVICSHKQKIKIQQFLVNMIDSLNHYMNKVEGFRVFYYFLSQKWTIEAYFYFLVLRGLLEEITADRILQKGQSNQGFSSILGYRFRSNPYQKNISEEQAQNFLGVLCSGGLSCSQSKKKSYQTLFNQITQKMFYDQQRKKNYIRFYDLLQTLVNQYVQVDVSSCDMSLSKTQICQDDQSLSELITGQISHDSLLFKKNANKQNQSLCSYAVTLKPDQQQIYRQRVKQESQNNLKQVFKNHVYQKVQQMYSRLCTKISLQTSRALEMAIQAISQLDKGFWLRFRGQITDSQLLSIQRLQGMYRQRQNSPVLMNKLVKGVLLLPYIRQQMLSDLKL